MPATEAVTKVSILSWNGRFTCPVCSEVIRFNRDRKVEESKDLPRDVYVQVAHVHDGPEAEWHLSVYRHKSRERFDANTKALQLLTAEQSRGARQSKLDATVGR